jgi:hypothetical protein
MNINVDEHLHLRTSADASATASTGTEVMTVTTDGSLQVAKLIYALWNDANTAYDTTSSSGMMYSTGQLGSAPFNVRGSLILQARPHSSTGIHLVTGATPASRMSIDANGLATFNSNIGGGGTTNFLRADGTWAAVAGATSQWTATGNSIYANNTVTGNVLIGRSTDLSINTSYKNLYFLEGGIMYNDNATTSPYLAVMNNTYYNSSNSWTYIVTDEASLITMNGGNIGLYSVASGTGGTAVGTWDTLAYFTSTGLGLGGNGSPSYDLHVGTGLATGEVAIGINARLANQSTIYWQKASTSHFALYMPNSTSTKLRFWNNTKGDIMEINSAGEVMINTAGTTHGGSLAIQALSSAWTSHLNLISSDGTNEWNLLVDNGASDNLRFAFNASEKFAIQSSGDVVVHNNFYPGNGQFYVDASTERTGLMRIVESGANAWSGMEIYWSATAHWMLMGDENEYGAYDDEGNDWIWHYSENGALASYHNGSTKLATTSTGITVTGTGIATDWSASSDRRLKENIKYNESWLDRVVQLGEKIVRYDWKSGREGGKNNVGLIAQDVLKIAPEFVHTWDRLMNPEDRQDADNMKPAKYKEYYALEYNKLVAPLYSAFSEHYKADKVWKSEKDRKIEELESKVKTLEHKIEKYESRP